MITVTDDTNSTVNWKDMNPGRMRQLTVFVAPFSNIYHVNLKRPNKPFQIQIQILLTDFFLVISNDYFLVDVFANG